jgi:peptidoglycan/LPS O-acetylase OafA/YrhL
MRRPSHGRIIGFPRSPPPMNDYLRPSESGALRRNDRVEYSSNGSERPHLRVLDGIRGLAILLVLIHHSSPLESEKWASGIPLLRWVHVGWIGVDLFFVLSGFLITGILLDERGRSHYLRNFYARRFLRIFPLYYGVLFVLFCVLPIGLRLINLDSSAIGRLNRLVLEYREIQRNQVWLWMYLSNFAAVFSHIQWKSVGHFWSLAVEEQFYMIWPIVLSFSRGRRGLFAVCIVIVLMALGSRLAIPSMGLPQGVAYVLTPCRLDGLAMGGILAVLARGQGGLACWVTLGRVLGCGASAFVVWGFYWQGFPEHGDFFCTIGFSLLANAFTALLLETLTAPPHSFISRIFQSSVLLFLGKYSYGIYVYNRIIILPVRFLVQPEALARQFGSPLAGVLAMQLACGGASIGIAMLSWHLYEIHFFKLKKKFSVSAVVGRYPGDDRQR